jgi:L-ribulose-5-phosphate 3-epimerase
MINRGVLERRSFIRAAAIAGASAFTVTTRAAELPAHAVKPRSEVQPCLFTKPLGNRKAAELPTVVRGLGIDAVDLTCRPEGHVLPERVADDLPVAVQKLRAAGITVPMITTALTDADKDHAETIIKTASQLGIRYMKPAYYTYKDLGKILPTLAESRSRLRGLADLCRQYNVQLGYHIHSGYNVGSGLWDASQLLEGLPPAAVGCYYDARHATVEGGLAGWEIGLNLLLPRIKMIAVKDFEWRKRDNGKWEAADVPLGQGMVHHDRVLKRLKQGGFAGPVSLHCEYCSPQVPIDSPAERANWDSIRKDWRTLQDLLKRADLL